MIPKPSQIDIVEILFSDRIRLYRDDWVPSFCLFCVATNLPLEWRMGQSMTTYMLFNGRGRFLDGWSSKISSPIGSDDVPASEGLMAAVDNFFWVRTLTAWARFACSLSLLDGPFDIHRRKCWCIWHTPLRVWTIEYRRITFVDSQGYSKHAIDRLWLPEKLSTSGASEDSGIPWAHMTNSPKALRRFGFSKKERKTGKLSARHEFLCHAYLVLFSQISHSSIIQQTTKRNMAPLQDSVCCPSSPEIMQSPQQLKGQSKEAKRISFHRRVTVRHTFNLESCTDEEKSAIWYTQVELHQIRADVRHEVTMLSAGTSSTCLELRGLESLLPDGLSQKLRHRQVSRSIVLNEQDYQWKRDMNDPDLIADLYFDKTRASVMAARVRAIADHEAVTQQSPPTSPKLPSCAKLFRSGSIGSLQRRQPTGFSSRAA